MDKPVYVPDACPKGFGTFDMTADVCVVCPHVSFCFARCSGVPAEVVMEAGRSGGNSQNKKVNPFRRGTKQSGVWAAVLQIAAEHGNQPAEISSPDIVKKAVELGADEHKVDTAAVFETLMYCAAEDPEWNAGREHADVRLDDNFRDTIMYRRDDSDATKAKNNGKGMSMWMINCQAINEKVAELNG
jgi:hypothetical protein